jgi:hypothetical protein
MRLHTVALLLVSFSVACAASTDNADLGENDLVSGTPESGYRAVGYLAASDAPAKALCGATLIASNVVVTSAHCVYRNRSTALQFGTGELGGTRTHVAEVVYHPDAHMESQGRADLVHTLLLHDVAYLVLSRPVEGVTPLELDTEKAKHATAVKLIGYGAGATEQVQRKGASGRVVLNAKLGTDTIVEIRPTRGAAICHRDGDEGHAALSVDSDGNARLLGIYVGSVTQSLTDCRKYAQLLNGYEATFGYADFYREGIARGRERL